MEQLDRLSSGLWDSGYGNTEVCQMAVSLPIILTAELANEVLEPLYVVLSVSLRILSGGLHIALGSVDTIVWK